MVAAFSDPILFLCTRGRIVPWSPEMEQPPPERMGWGELMIMTDPPVHGAMRRAFNRLFLPRPVGRYENPGEALVAEILADVMTRGECDFVVDVAARLPMAFICEIMDIPRQDWPDLFRWGNMSVGFEDPEYQVASGSPFETRQAGIEKLGSYTTQRALERRGSDGEDLLSVLGNATLGGRPLTESELFHNGWLYVLGGLETTRNAISGALLALIQHPTERARIVKRPDLM